MIWDEMVTVGRIIRPHGNRGQVVIVSETDFGADRFHPGAILQMRRDERIEPLTVVESREHHGRWIVGLAGVSSIDEAEAFRGVELRIAAGDVHGLDAGDYYVHDLVGCRVETTAGSPVGTVSAVQLGTGTPLLVVAAKTGEVLVPLAEAICRRVDIGEKLVVIEAIDGLLELNEPGKRP